MPSKGLYLRKAMMKINRKVLGIIGIIIFVIILSRLDLKEVYHIIRSIDPTWIAALVVMRILYIIIRSYAWQYILRLMRIRYPLSRCFLVYCAGQFVGQVTPGRLGDLVRVVYLKKDGYNLIRPLITVLLDRISDITFVLLASYLSMYIFIDYFFEEIIWISLLIFISIIIIILALLNGRLVKRLVYTTLDLITPKRYRHVLRSNISELFKEMKRIKFSRLIAFFMMITTAWLFYFFQMYILVIAMDIPINFWYTVVIISVTGMVVLLPISVSGIGTRDLSFIFLLGLMGVSRELALSYSLMALVFNLVPAVIGFIFWTKNPGQY